jgi:cell division protein FtsN
MAKNTKNYRTQKGSRKSARTVARTPGWVWLFTGLILGLLIAGFIYIRYFADNDWLTATRNNPAVLADRMTATHTPIISGDIQPKFAQTEKKVIAQTKATSKTKPTTAPSTTPVPEEKPRFEFYTMLPDIEVPVENKEQTAKKDVRTPSPTTSIYLQLGSFSNAQDADTMKATLNLQGFEIHTKQVTVNGAKYYRLVMGPYPSDAKAREMQKKLNAAQISSIVLRETV